MDNGFTKQNKTMDYLLNLDNDIIKVSDGQIAVPVYHMQERGMKLVDEVTISNKEFTMKFTITDFVRDAVNNPSVLNAKRFLVSEHDYSTIYKQFGNPDNIEYMIEFQLTNIDKLADFTNAYQSANLPQAGPAASYSLLKVMNALSDGLIAAVVILVSMLLVIVAMLCLRFTIITMMEEDYREIGVMKAIGIGETDIRIDLQHIENISQKFSSIQSHLKQDGEIEKYAGFVTSRLKVYDSEGMSQSINIESGDFSVFPLQYLEGKASASEEEIALSTLSAQDLNVSSGDTLRLMGADIAAWLNGLGF